jgi:hypothetical protein
MGSDRGLPWVDSGPSRRAEAAVSREKQGRGGKTVTMVRGLVLDAIALTTTGKQLRAACGAAGTITMCMGSNWTSRCTRSAPWPPGRGRHICEHARTR